MKPVVLSLLMGLVVGVLYALMGVRSPAPPVVALVGLLGILLGEQLPPLIKTLATGPPSVAERVRAAPAPNTEDSRP